MACVSRKRRASSASAAERRARRIARRPRRRRNEKPAAASRRPHRSDSARSRYMRRRSDAVGCRLASASGIARLLCHWAPAARGDAPVSLIPRHELGWEETGTGERSRVAHFSSSPGAGSGGLSNRPGSVAPPAHRTVTLKTERAPEHRSN
jgi:hypothetical protein